MMLGKQTLGMFMVLLWLPFAAQAADQPANPTSPSSLPDWVGRLTPMLNHPTYDSDILILPRVDAIGSTDEVGKYQNAIFQLTGDGTWRLEALDVDHNGFENLMPDLPVVDVVKVGTQPVSVYLRVAAQIDACKSYAGPVKVMQRRWDSGFQVMLSIPVTPAAARSCVGVPYEQVRVTIPLEVYGLKAGAYSYLVNAVWGTFTLDADNWYPDDCIATNPYRCPPAPTP
jgi:hypothetical protein